MYSLFEIWSLCRNIADGKILTVNYHFFSGKIVDICQIIIKDENDVVILDRVFNPDDAYDKETVHNQLFGILYEQDEMLSSREAYND